MYAHVGAGAGYLERLQKLGCFGIRIVDYVDNASFSDLNS